MRVLNIFDSPFSLDANMVAAYIPYRFGVLPPMTIDNNRRDFLLRSCSGLTAVWLSANWPALLSAAAHAHNAAQSPAASKLEFFTTDQAKEIDAITARIIPTDETPGAHEAGVAYFIDRALTTFAIDNQKIYREGLPEMHARTHELFSGLDKFSAATPEQQDQVLHSFDEQAPGDRRPYRPRAAAQSFFDTLRLHTIVAFLLDPDAGGDPNGIGWKVIDRERQHMFQPPFGYYDKNYPGWQPAPGASDKAKS
jgi:gluconate 2-dehydrogenase gamma chain